MRFIYHSSCPGISPQVAAGIHLGILPRNRIPNRVEWERVLDRTGLGGARRGGVHLMGKTRGGDEIYNLYYPLKPGPVVLKSTHAALEMMGIPQQEIAVIDCGQIGGAISISAQPPDERLRILYPLLVQLVEKAEGGVLP